MEEGKTVVVVGSVCIFYLTFSFGNGFLAGEKLVRYIK